MVTVVGISTILFLLVTTLMVLTGYRTMQTSSSVSRIQATQLADAGLNYYLYQLSLDYNYYSKSPAPAPSATNAQGSWTASATYDTTTQLVVIRSVGTLPNGVSRVVLARCSPPPPPMYAVGSGGDIDVGANTTIQGPLRSNGYVHISSTRSSHGVITGRARSGHPPNGDFTPMKSGVPDPAYFQGGAQYSPQLSFDQMSTDVAAMRGSAGLLLPSSRSDGKTPSALGYQITLDNNRVIVSRVKAESRAYNQTRDIANLGKLTTTIPSGVQSIYAIPANGVIFVDGDNLWVSGTYSARVTICASRMSGTDATYGNITVSDSVLCSDKTNPQIVCGLMAQNNVWLPDWYSTNQMDKILTIEAALLAQFGRIGDARNGSTTFPLPSNNGNYPTHDLDLAGSALGCTGVGFQTDYFINRTYGFDERLKTNPPPYWPRGDKQWIVVATWQG
ncbi:MAG TPA: hypothetical protein VIK31_03370 [Propionibacteriaceae bacterium]